MKDGSIRRSKLNFGDLAGSEDIKKALGNNPDPERLKEAQKINLSLTMLTTAIQNLSKVKTFSNSLCVSCVTTQHNTTHIYK